MTDWLYTLSVKSLLSDEEGVDYSAEAARIAPIIAQRVRALMQQVDKVTNERLCDRLGDLYIELDEVADCLDYIGRVGPYDHDAQTALNEALELLYNVGDDNKRIWVK